MTLPESFVVDILLNLEKLKAITVNFTNQDEMECAEAHLFDAAMHNLEQIGEALKHILDDDQLKDVVDPKWRSIVDFRNVLVHEYFGIDMDEIFRVFEYKLPTFEKEFLIFVQLNIQHEPLFKKALGDAITEMQARSYIALEQFLQEFLKNS